MTHGNYRLDASALEGNFNLGDIDKLQIPVPLKEHHSIVMLADMDRIQCP